MPPIIAELLGLVGYLVRVLGFLLFGFAAGRFVLDQFKNAAWQVQVALALGFFGLAAALTNYATPGASGAFALGGGVALIAANMPKRGDDEESSKKK
ncbi:MAG: hypothetical protein IT313_14335 [Anaerolineales bacterium]|nr:hypothetical protein [Anaerolineales bacterium]